MASLPNISLACLSLDSSTCSDISGSNGLPLTPNSIKIIGNFKAHVEHVEHPNLTRYFECFRNKNERVTLVFENSSNESPFTRDDIHDIVKQLLDALHQLHGALDCVHGLITTNCLRWSNGKLKLAHWPISLLTDNGITLGATSILPTDVSFISPEQVKEPGRKATQESDIWSAGLALLKFMNPKCRLPDNPCRLAYCHNSKQVIEQISGTLNDEIVTDSSLWNKFFERMLDPDFHTRATIDELYSMLGDKPQKVIDLINKPPVANFFEMQQDEISNLDISEIYYLWRLSIGRNFESDQELDGCPPILKIPYLIISEKLSDYESKLKNYIIIDVKPKPIDIDDLISKISLLNERIFHPLVLTEDVSYDQVGMNLRSQPIVIKEADFAYQCERIILFKRLLAGCPYLKDQLKREATVDIPPYYRAQTWSLLLEVCPIESQQLFGSIDKTTSSATDRQISVDIPRCHQYNELMASPQGHQKLARILKAWLNHNKDEYVYWQGLDSLAAPFLLLNFDNEAMAFACFNSFVEKYLKGFFRMDNQLIVQQYLTMFSELLSYHDSSLAAHLEKLGFLPNLYAIPWFLTMFTHVLPLHKILHVWDRLLLGDEKFPLCIGLAILNQLRQELMGYSFNDCIVAFSDLPEINIERCIRDASHYYNSTPDKLINLSIIRECQELW